MDAEEFLEKWNITDKSNIMDTTYSRDNEMELMKFIDALYGPRLPEVFVSSRKPKKGKFNWNKWTPANEA